jgi:tetratricopeptide (TPR) repeat protein
MVDKDMKVLRLKPIVATTKIAIAFTTILCPLHAPAQTNGGTGSGLDKLDEQQVMGELASANLTTLLDRDFENFKIPAAERGQMMAVIKIKTLVNGRLGIAERRALALEVAEGFDKILPRQTDPTQLMEFANELFLNGIVPTVTELEYFGENPVSKAQLKPVAEVAKKMYAQVAKLAEAKANVLANTINNGNVNTVLPQVKALNFTKLFGVYSDNMASYSLCISLNPGDPERKSLAADSYKYLSQFDNPTSGVQPLIRIQLGKLQLVSGDFAAAKSTFDSIVNNPGLAIKPAPDPTQQNDARYFGIVADIDSRKLQASEKEIADLESWENQNYLPRLNPTAQEEVKAALAMLKFRLYSAQSDLTIDQDEKKKTNDQAIDVLSELLKQQPGLKELVFDQLLGRIPAQPDYTALNPLVLQAIRQQGFSEVIKKDGEPFDKTKLTKAIPAAQELVRRRGHGVDDNTAMLSAYFIPYAYMKLDQKKEAAAAFMDFAEKFASLDMTKSQDSMSNAEGLVKELRIADKDDQDTRKLYDRFLPMAIGAPYNEKRFAFGYATLLFEEGQLAKAVDYYQLVPDSDKQYPQAQYSQLVVLSQELKDKNTTLSDEQQKKIVNRILDLAAKIDNFYTDAKTAELKKKYQEWVAVTDGIAAELTLTKLNDPARSLKILTGFESKIKGTRNERLSGLEAMRLRINDYLDMSNLDAATKNLEQLLAVDPDAGEKLLFQVLRTVHTEKDDAEAAGNIPKLKQLAANQATLTGLVVDYASKKSEYASRLPNYIIFDADSKREVAELVDDPAQKRASLEIAQKQYQKVLSTAPDNLPAQLGMGLTQYDLGDFAGATKMLIPLVNGHKVGEPTTTVMVAGNPVQVENTEYWEVNLKVFRAALELAKANPKDADAMDNAQIALKKVVTLFILDGDSTGGKKYHADFVKLKQDMDSFLPAAAALKK